MDFVVYHHSCEIWRTLDWSLAYLDFWIKCRFSFRTREVSSVLKCFRNMEAITLMTESLYIPCKYTKSWIKLYETVNLIFMEFKYDVKWRTYVLCCVCKVPVKHCYQCRFSVIICQDSYFASVKDMSNLFFHLVRVFFVTLYFHELNVSSNVQVCNTHSPFLHPRKDKPGEFSITA